MARSRPAHDVPTRSTIAALLYRLGRRSAERPVRTILLCLVVAVLVVAGGARFGAEPSGSLTLPGTETQRALDVLERSFPGAAGATGQVVFHVDGGRLDDDVRRAVVAGSIASLRRGDGVVDVSDPFAEGGTLSADGRTAIAVVRYATDPPPDDAPLQADRAVDTARREGVQIELSSTLDARDGVGGKELIGLVVAIVVLLVAFGSVVATGLPIATALFGVAMGSALVAVVAAATDMPTAGPLVATMIGLGVGIDYALFVVSRYRDLLGTGAPVVDAVGRATATAGTSVLFAGGTVVIALAGLQLAGVPAIAAMGIAAALVVLVAMGLAITLLPALLGLLGHRIDRFSVHRARRRTPATRREPVAARWAAHVGRYPTRYAIAGAAVLLAVAAPAASMRLGLPDDGNLPSDTSARRAYDLTADAFGPGANGPLTIVVDGVPGSRGLDRIRAAVAGDPGVAVAAEASLNERATTAVIRVIPRSAPQDRATAQLVHRLRTDVLPAAHAEGTKVYVAGATAVFVDVSDRLGERLPVFIGAVVLLSFLLLVVVFRSVLVPVKAALMNLLSIGAAYGVVVAVFQWGWGASLVGVHHTVPIDPFLPTVMFAILFGLSMDYEVFLLSRIREEYDRSGDSHGSVATGLARSARLITSAALIMMAVFASFVADPSVVVKMYGLGLTVAVFVDATVVRMVLVPATMALLGDANWWLPRWLARVLPHVALEAKDDEPPATVA